MRAATGRVVPPRKSSSRDRFHAADQAICSVAFGALEIPKIAEVNDPYPFLAVRLIGDMRALLAKMGWLMGLEPTTTGITNVKHTSRIHVNS